MSLFSLKRFLILSLFLVCLAIPHESFSFTLIELDLSDPELNRTCTTQTVQSAGGETLPEGECSRTVCQGNLWGKSATDICSNGETRTEGEGENAVIYEVLQMRRPSQTLASEAWVEVPSRATLTEIDPELIPIEGGTASLLEDVFLKSAWADHSPFDLTEWTDAERTAVADKMVEAFEILRHAWEIDETFLTGEDRTELRSYYFLTLDTISCALSILGYETNPPSRYPDICNPNLNLVWGFESIEDDIGLGGTGARLVHRDRIIVNGDVMLERHPDLAAFVSTVLIHEVAHLISYENNRFGGWFDLITGRLLSPGNAWQAYHEESTAYMINSIYGMSLVMGTEEGLVMPTSDIPTHWALEYIVELLDTNPPLARNTIPPKVLAKAFILQYPELARQILVLEGSIDTNYDRDVIYNYLDRIDFVDAYLSRWEDQFQSAGGVFNFWPECHEYWVGTEDWYACRGRPSDIQPPQHGDEIDSPQVDGGQNGGEAEVLPDEEESIDWEAPARPDQIGSSEFEDEIIPISCADTDYDSESGVNPACIVWCEMGGLYTGICRTRIDEDCSAQVNPQDRLHCVHQCERSSEDQEYCANICQVQEDNGEEWHSFCSNVCSFQQGQPEYCRSRCASDEFEVSFYAWCPELCEDDINHSWCEDFCEVRSGSGFEWCGTFCEENYRPWCDDLCEWERESNLAEPDPGFCSSSPSEGSSGTPETGSSGSDSSAGSGEEPEEECYREFNIMFGYFFGCSPFVGYIESCNGGPWEPASPNMACWGTPGDAAADALYCGCWEGPSINTVYGVHIYNCCTEFNSGVQAAQGCVTIPGGACYCTILSLCPVGHPNIGRTEW